MRYTSDSSNDSGSRSLNSRALSRSCPNGFSTTSRRHPLPLPRPAAQRIPSHGGVGAAFRSPIDHEVLGVMNRRLRSQHVKTVVKLDRVLIDPVLEAPPF